MATLQLIDRCPICTGSAGQIPVGGHYLCQEKQKLGLPCESLGEKCEACNGSGRELRPMRPGILLPMNPSGREMELWFPKCKQCDGKGYNKS